MGLIVTDEDGEVAILQSSLGDHGVAGGKTHDGGPTPNFLPNWLLIHGWVQFVVIQDLVNSCYLSKK